MISNFFEVLTEMISHFGYLGILLTTGLEYACFPVSSEILLPFIGYTIAKGELNLILSILVSTVGGVLGCSFCYMIGKFGGSFIEKTICRKCKSAQIGINHAKSFFVKHGKQSVMVGRVFPIVRTYISIPAGMAGMSFGPFLIYTAIGALIWNTALISCGYFLGEHWEETKLILEENKELLIFGIILILIFLFLKKYKKHRA